MTDIEMNLLYIHSLWDIVQANRLWMSRFEVTVHSWWKDSAGFVRPVLELAPCEACGAASQWRTACEMLEQLLRRGEGHPEEVTADIPAKFGWIKTWSLGPDL